MGYANGRLPDSVLAPVAGGRLRKDAALRWNAMNFYRRSRGWSTVLPNGPDSTYRNYARQIYWRNWWCARGKCGNAAVPGTSNHGWGLAVDTKRWSAVNATGAPFGWQKRWSDAAHEPWHFKWAGFGRTAGGERRPTMRPGGSYGTHGRLAKRTLKRRGLYAKKLDVSNGKMGGYAVKAVKAFQRNNGLRADGVVGPKTWTKLLKRR